MEGFKKASFFDKILPDRVEIFSKTRRAWTCFFVNLELTFALFFLFFILNIQSKCCCLIGLNLKEWELNWKMVVFGKGVKFWGTDEKTKSNTINAFHPALKFYTLSFSFWFLRMPKRNYEWRIINLVVLKIGGIFKKQWKNFPSASAEAQSKGIIFLFAYWEFLIAFINSWCHK